jgi:Predicted membrane protein
MKNFERKMLMNLWEKHKSLILEFLRFGIVGVISFIADAGVLYLFLRVVFKQPEIQPDVNLLFISTTLGFIVGVIVNYILSVIFVFTSAKQSGKGKSTKSFIIFVIISVIGLLMTNGLMYLFVDKFKIYDMIAKVIATTIVMVWNYIGRKVFIFK